VGAGVRVGRSSTRTYPSVVNVKSPILIKEERMKNREEKIGSGPNQAKEVKAFYFGVYSF